MENAFLLLAWIGSLLSVSLIGVGVVSIIGPHRIERVVDRCLR